MVSLGYVMLDEDGDRLTVFIHTKEESDKWLEMYGRYFPLKKVIVKEVFYND